MNFNRYFSNEEIQAQLQAWAVSYPTLVTLIQIGQSYNGLPLWLIAITNKATGEHSTKPSMWIDANIHATELAGSTVAMYIIEHLIQAYGKEDRVDRLLNRAAIYVVPRANPDGVALAMSENPRYVRSGIRRYPWEELDEGLHVQDINGDGQILQMRVPDSNGDWKISSLDSRLMQKRQPDEMLGTFYRLFPEGLLEEYDGHTIKMARPPEGLDFNRNFPFEWRPEGSQHGAGPYPTSEPEVRALVDFIASHNNINVAISLHTYSRAILRPYSTKSDDDMIADDLWVYKKMGERGTQLTGYRNVSTFHDFKYHPKEVTTGAFDDWIYDHFGAFAFTIELWDLPTAAGIKDRKFIDWFRAHPHEEDQQILNWIEQNAPTGAYVDWQPFHHPQLGMVELGGWNTLYTWRNPPHALMEAEAANQYPFILSLAEMLPTLEVKTLESEALGNGYYTLNLVVENIGFLPSYTSRQARERAIARPVFVELELPEGIRLINGKKRTEIGHLEGRSNKLDVSSLGAASPTDNRLRVEWTLYAPAGGTISLRINSDRAGKLIVQHAISGE
jgi:murein tripeptide amidase MpaA